MEAVNWSPEWKPKARRRVLSDPRGLYLSEGYTVADASDPQSDTMVKILGALFSRC